MPRSTKRRASSPILLLLASAMLAAVTAVTAAPVASAQGGFSLSYSFSSDRSGAMPLDGARLPDSGQVAVFVDPLDPDDVRRVSFFVNGRFFKTEFLPPYDLGGTRGSRAALVPLRLFAEGRNVIEVVARLRSSGRTTVAATFEVGEPAEPTILDLVESMPRFSILAAAIEAAGLEGLLDGTVPLTLFAPNDDAFLALLAALDTTAQELLEDEELLRTVLAYHVVEGVLFATDVLAEDTLIPLQGEPIDVNAPELKLNESMLVVSGLDMEASNGVVHEIDAVLLPPSLTTTIAELAASVPQLSILLEAAAEVGLDALLSVNGPQLTVFAPTDQAFLDLLGALGLTKDELFADRGLLLTVLLYHIVNEELFAEDVLALEEIFPAESEPIAVDAKRGKLNDSNLILTDQNASNGVVHLIDAVLVPPAALELLP